MPLLPHLRRFAARGPVLLLTGREEHGLGEFFLEVGVLGQLDVAGLSAKADC